MSAGSIGFLDKFSIAIIELLASDPLSSHYQREIAKKAGVSVGKTNQILKALEEEEVVLKARVGKVDLYRYNLQSPLARLLKILFSLYEIGGLIKNLRNKSNRIILYGSCAEGSDTKESDVDLLVVSDEKQGTERTIRNEARSIERTVSPIILTPLEFSGLKQKDSAFYEQVSRGMTLWEKEVEAAQKQ
jgi:predicted nucleotidyltransferase